MNIPGCLRDLLALKLSDAASDVKQVSISYESAERVPIFNLHLARPFRFICREILHSRPIPTCKCRKILHIQSASMPGANQSSPSLKTMILMGPERTTMETSASGALGISSVT